MSRAGVGLPEALERAAEALSDLAGGVRPANGDPVQLLELLDAEAAAVVLEWLLRHEPEAGEELATAWAEDPESGLGPLGRIAPESLPKSSRRALRRVLHRLRSRGIELTGDRPESVVAKLPSLADDLSAAVVSALDPRGARLAYLVESHPSGGARLFNVALDDTRGVMEFDVYSTGRSKARKFLRELHDDARMPAVAVPPESVRALIDRIASGQPADRPLPQGYSEWRSRVAVAPEGASTPGELVRRLLGDGGGDLDRAVALIRSRAIGPWPPDVPLLNDVAKQLGEVGESRIVVSGVSRRRQTDAVLDEGLKRIFSESFSAITSRRFEETAYVIWKHDRYGRQGKMDGDGSARDCLAAARAFAEKAPTDNPVARAMLEVLLEPALRKLDREAKSEDDPSLLVKP
ncbi:MAG: hypothetical protein V3T07_00345 [Myxococcota bacterium]